MEQTTTLMAESSSNKRPRSPTTDNPFPPAKIPRIQAGQVQINYLARQSNDTLPVASANDLLPEIVRLIGEYDSVLQRHESLAVNLGACPLGPILLKRFERLFDGPPRILKSHGRDSNVTWLDVVEFAQNKPEQFNLEKTRNGVPVCQFYTKQCRVEISEEDYVLIASGIPQKMIPPQPILEDEEKELKVIDLLERNFGQVIQLADQVSGRARQLTHKLKTRRSAIMNRREQDQTLRHSNGAPLSPLELNGLNTQTIRSIETSQSPPTGFTPVNVRPSAPPEMEARPTIGAPDITSGQLDELFPSARTQNVTIINGQSIKDASPTRKAELMKKFLSSNEREADPPEDMGRRSSFTVSRSNSIQGMAMGHHRGASLNTTIGAKGSTTVAIPSTPASLLPQVKPSSMERDDGGPFKAEMVTRMEVMHRGQRILPPCDRCRRLHMDCLKNLTACIGCTKKHAKCSWKDVRMEELQAQASTPDEQQKGVTTSDAPPLSVGSTIEVFRGPDDISRPPTSVSSMSDNEMGVKPALEEVVNTSVSAPVPKSPAEPRPERPEAPKFDVRPPPIYQQPSLQSPRDISKTRSTSIHHSPPFVSPTEEHILSSKRIDRGHDESDRLQALATQVYRSASQSVKSSE